MKFILLTGGAGYIGSHTALEMLKCGYNLIVLDSLINSSRESLLRVENLTNKKIVFIEGDVRCTQTLNKIFENYKISGVIHFAGLKSVGDSSKLPLEYYDVNVTGTLTLLKVMERYSVFNFIFSSSATVYGDSDVMPISECHPLKKPTNPYGYSKFMVEEMLKDLSMSDSNWSIGILRYFNPVGAHESGIIGEDPNGIPNNLVPYISQVAIGKLPCLNVYGDDYPTKDGTGIRDYIHVVDLANGHLKTLLYLEKNKGVFTWNLGTGKGYSVLDVVNMFKYVSKKNIPIKVLPRRIGDISVCYTDPSKAKKDLNWEANYNLMEMLKDTWNWQQLNPMGFNV